MKIEHLSYSYRTSQGEASIFEDLSYDFKDRGLVAILGRSGSGKSTLLSAMAGFLKPTRGKVILEGGKPGVVFQDPHLLEESDVMDNASLPLLLEGRSRAECEGRLLPILQRLGILPLKEKRAKDLSGGEKMRVSLARAMSTHPDAYLADEPTGALDRSNATGVMSLLKELSSSALVVCVTHDEKLALAYGDTVLRLEGGKLFEIKRRKLEKRCNKNILDNKKLRFSWRNTIRLTKTFLAGKSARLALTSLALGLAFACLASALSIRQGKAAIAERIARGFFDASVVHASEVSTILQENGMSLTKNLPLTDGLLEEVSLRQGVKAYPSLAFFVPPASECYAEEEKIAYGLEPIFVEGWDSSEDFVSCAVNDVFSRLSGKKEGDVLTVRGEGRTYDGDDPIVFEKNWNFRIEEVREEIQGFSAPTLFYDYGRVFSEVVEARIAPEAEKRIGELLGKEGFREDVLMSFETLLLTPDAFALQTLAREEFQGRLKVSSRALAAEKSSAVLVDSATSLASIFFALSGIISFFILLFSLSTLMRENLKNYAIVLAFCAERRAFRRFYEGVPLAFSLSALLAYAFFCALSAFFLPHLLDRFGYPDLFAGGMTFLSLALMGTAIVALSLFGSFLTYRRLTGKELLTSLRSGR